MANPSKDTYLGVILRAQEDWGYGRRSLQTSIYGLSKVAKSRPDLVARYKAAMRDCKATEIEALLIETDREIRKLAASGDLSPERQPFFFNIRVNCTTRCLHLGHSSRSFPLFPAKA